MVGDYSQHETLESYMSLVRERPELFYNKDERGIEILTSLDEIKAAQDSARRSRLKSGLETMDLRAGLLARDPYMIMLRDAVRFLDGSLGLYNRIVELPSVAVMPLLDGRPVLIKIFRHGLRDWALEFPRGGCDPGETPETAIHRELAEEIGANIMELIPLGDFTPGGSSLSIRAKLFAAHIDQIGRPNCTDGIGDVRAVDTSEVEELIRTSRIIDGFTLSTFLRARLAGLI